MAASFSPWPLPCLLLLLLLLPPFISATTNYHSSSSSSTTATTNSTTLNAIRSVCKSTPHPELCLDTLKDFSTLEFGPSNNVITFLLHTIQAAVTEATNLASVFPDTGIVEKQKSAIQDCKDLHNITLFSLKRSASLFRSSTTGVSKSAGTVNAYLSAALTNKNTCLEGLSTSSGPLLPVLVQSLTEAYKHVRNSLAIVAKWTPTPSRPAVRHNRKVLDGFPSWLKRKDRRLLQGDDYGGGDDEDEAFTLVVAEDGSGDFRTVSDAVAHAPSNSEVRTLIMVKAGLYEENVEIPANKMNIALIGDGSENTVISGRRSAADGWTTYRSATVGVSAEGFLARDITIENTAGASKGQATALRINADLAALYRCTIAGYQDTLYVHSFRQFYRECNILGTVDFICGNAAVVLQRSRIIALVPLHGQSNVITAQSRDDPNEDTGISIQSCAVVASYELAASPGSARTYLGRPWMAYSRTVYLESFLDELVDPAGWTSSVGEMELDKLYYGEYENIGPGAPTGGRVDWPGYHVMDYEDAVNFTVSELIQGDQWLDSPSFPYDDGI